MGIATKNPQTVKVLLFNHKLKCEYFIMKFSLYSLYSKYSQIYKLLCHKKIKSNVLSLSLLVLQA